ARCLSSPPSVTALGGEGRANCAADSPMLLHAKVARRKSRKPVRVSHPSPSSVGSERPCSSMSAILGSCARRLGRCYPVTRQPRQSGAVTDVRVVPATPHVWSGLVRGFGPPMPHRHLLTDRSDRCDRRQRAGNLPHVTSVIGRLR